MPFDAYSICPGGRNKKIKFCCPHLLDDLNKIDKMMESEQFAACLTHVESLEKKDPENADCICLQVVKLSLLRIQQRLDESLALAEELAVKEPENSVVLSELSLSRALLGRPVEAMDAWQKAVEAGEPGRIAMEAVQTMEIMAAGFMMQAQPLAAIGLAAHHMALTNDPAVWRDVQNVPGLPPLLLAPPQFQDCPESVPFKADYDEAVGLVSQLRWRMALAKLESLTDQADQFPWLWRAVAMLRSWLLDQDGCVEAYHKLAQSDIDPEDAAEATLMTLFLSDDPLGDHVDINRVVYEVTDFDLANESFLSWDHAFVSPVDPQAWNTEEAGPAPKSEIALFDGPKPADDAPLDPEKLPISLAECLFFGKETDRPARLMFGSLAVNRREQVEAMLKEKLGDAIGEVAEEEKLAGTSLTFQSLRPRWRTPPQPTREAVEKLTNDFKTDFFLSVWPNQSLGLFDGKTPLDASAEADQKSKLSAAVLLIEHWCGETMGEFDFNQLREKLSLPLAEMLPALDEKTILSLSPLKLTRLPFEELTDQALSAAFNRALVVRVEKAAKQAGEILISRESVPAEMRMSIFRFIASSERSPIEALKTIAAAKEFCAKENQSCAQFDLMSIPLLLEMGQVDQMMAVLRHVETDHIQEQGVPETLTHMLVQLGLVRPDGMPAGMPGQGPGPAGPAPTEGGGLWTPDGQSPPPPSDDEGEQGGGSKLWTPGM
jgi:hypothetical protein